MLAYGRTRRQLLDANDSAKATPEAPVIGADNDPELAERFRLMNLADETRARRIRAQADAVAESVVTMPAAGMKVRRLEWIELERGWGIRPDGDSLHLTDDDAKAYVAEYWEAQPDKAPDEYSAPAGPFGGPVTTVEVTVDRETYDKVARSRNGIWRY